MDIHDIAKSLGAVAVEVENDDDAVSLTDEQIVIRLREMSALVLEPAPHVFSTGDILQHKLPSTAPTRFCERPVVFARYLDQPRHGFDARGNNADHLATNGGAAENDCIIYHLRPSDKNTFRPIPMLTDSKWWQPHPDFKKDGS